MVQRVQIELPAPLRDVKAVTAEPDGPAACGTPEAPAIAPGLAPAVELARQQLVGARQALGQAAQQVAALEEDILREAREHLVDLAAEIARKVLVQEIEEGRYRIEPIVKAALENAPSRREIVVHLHPDDFARAQEAAEAGPEGEGGHGLAGVRLFPDPAVRRAECRLEMAEGCVEVAVDMALERLRREMKQAT